jgi:hypothetical protein
MIVIANFFVVVLVFLCIVYVCVQPISLVAFIPRGKMQCMKLFMEKNSEIQVERQRQNGLLVTGIVHKTVACPQHVSDENIEHIREVFVLHHTTVERGCHT